MRIVLLFSAAIVLSLPALSQDRGTVLSMQGFLDAVKEQSPDLAITKANSSAARARASGIRLAPPMVGFMQMKEGSSRANGLEVSQEIPFPTKIYSERKVRQLDAQAQEENSSTQSATILAEARLAYVSFWNAAERLEILREKLNWLRRHTRLASSSARYNSESQIHFLEIESIADETENEVLAAESDLVEKRNELKTFAPKLDLDNLKPEEPPITRIESPSESAPIIRALEKEIESKAAMESLAKSGYLPDFFVRYRSFEESGVIPKNEELMVGVTLPFLYFWQPNADSSGASAERLRAEAELLKTKANFNSRVGSLQHREKSIRAQLSNIKGKLLPRSEKRSRLAKNISQRTMEGLDQHNSIMLAHLNLKLSALELRLQHERTIKEITALTGQPTKAGTK